MNLIVYVEILVFDLGRVMCFYVLVFGVVFGEVVILYGSRMVYFFFEEGCDGVSGVFVEGDVYVFMLYGVIIYLNVVDLDVVIVWVFGEGSEIFFLKMLFGDGVFIVEIRDSEGNCIVL